MDRRSMLSGAVALLTGAATAPLARAAEACGGFRWDVAAEMALFRGSAIPVVAGRSPSPAPLLDVGRLYAVALAPQGDVELAAPPAKPMLADGAHAGILRIQVPAAGCYRVSQDAHFWVDVLQAGKLLPSVDFQGSIGCEPQKIVMFDMPAGSEILVQFSGSTQAVVRVAVTAAG